MSEKDRQDLKSGKKINRCLSCGKYENLNNRKYCSIRCRQILRQRLNARNGLLQALNARYATFYFSDTMIFLDIIAAGHKEIFRFVHRRLSGKTPSEDFNVLANELGRAWWSEEKRSKKKYLASSYVLALAVKTPEMALVKPKVLKSHKIQARTLDYLGMDKADLSSVKLKGIIKNAYRRQAKIHHPDVGGKSAAFRKINTAYHELLHWAENPRFIRRKGFTDKWFYDGASKKWVQPIPIKKTEP
ncbi:MAG TPA: J domain-containing protein [Deltaproteobacteria bacterium]|nr:J domain-containing protein [Deltaproteobacteria bacterium]